MDLLKGNNFTTFTILMWIGMVVWIIVRRNTFQVGINLDTLAVKIKIPTLDITPIMYLHVRPPQQMTGKCLLQFIQEE